MSNSVAGCCGREEYSSVWQPRLWSHWSSLHFIWGSAVIKGSVLSIVSMIRRHKESARTWCTLGDAMKSVQIFVAPWGWTEPPWGSQFYFTRVKQTRHWNIRKPLLSVCNQTWCLCHNMKILKHQMNKYLQCEQHVVAHKNTVLHLLQSIAHFVLYCTVLYCTVLCCTCSVYC